MGDVIGFDIETNLFQLGSGYDQACITCAALWSVERDKATICRGPLQEESGLYAPQLSQEEAAALVQHLHEATKGGSTIVTWNGAGFDFPVLAAVSGEFEVCKALALEHIDIAFLMLCSKGYMAGLSATAEGMGMGGKFDGIDGPLAATLWSVSFEQQRRVLRYVAQDARLTALLYQQILAQGYVTWITSKGRRSSWPVPLLEGRIPTVQEALQLPLPDTSWMTNPRTRESILAWMDPTASGASEDGEVTPIDSASTELEGTILRLDLERDEAAQAAAAAFAFAIQEERPALSARLQKILYKH